MTTPPVDLKQNVLGAEPPAAMSLFWRVRGAGPGDAAALWRVLAGMPAQGVVLGLGAPLVHAVDAEVAGLEPMPRLARGRFVMPSTQHDLFALVPGPDSGRVFEHAERLCAALAPVARLVEATPMFNYRRGRDLHGWQDGTENPKGDGAWAAALVPEGDGAGGSFVLVQRWLHFRERLAALPQPERDHVVGRTLDGDEEIDEAPQTAHVKRTAQEDFEPPAFLLRRSMPWGDTRRQGLVFVAYAAEAETHLRQLRRMLGFDDGIQDALLAHSQAETGGLYWCPPVHGGHLVLPAVSASVLAEAPAAVPPPPAEPVVRLVEDGPLEVEGCFDVDGTVVARGRLCRCGRSLRKPWCDSSHEDAGFAAAGEVPPIDEPAAAVVPACIRVRPVPDGPLALHGAVHLQTAGGRTILRCAHATLCRCGRSANKPFCDGSHAVVRFAAE